MTKISSKTQIKVRYGETDQMGVVYHGNYAQYFEIARIDWLEKLGFSYKKLEDNGIMLPVVALNTQFKSSALFDDVLTITTNLTKIPTAKIEFEYELHNQKGELLTFGNTVLVFVSKEFRRPIKCPENMLRKIQSLLEVTETP